MNKIDMASWLEDARKSIGWTQVKLASEMGLTQDKISNIKNGKRELSAEEAMVASRLTGYPLPNEGTDLRVLGYVGAGAEVYPIDDGDALYTIHVGVSLPHGSVGAIVRGDSMFPVFEDGDLVAYSGDTVEPEAAIGDTCIVQVADGRMLIKTIRRGSAPGLYTLTSYNAPDITDVPLDWARRFLMRLDRRAWRRNFK
ncbi:hypothetical protein ATN81_19185 [Agrobacterium pusense]|uniref:LexA family transcriptional regulator n=1 Tax=Agrobacterium pusense TaxID=648995 RepID=UPI00092B93C7|nr:helix-turn-helix domain-containing protein [Agrobacterium pusense]OJH53513.1 hypothetical protein ATN81_19185 [Agrobacterium pusense]OJH57684.1 hypothetical protein BA725_21085 [Agrobacterium pusense]